MRKSAEKRLKALFAEHSTPPLEVIIPILEKTGQGEQELTAQIYDTYAAVTKEIMKILGLKQKNMKTVAKVWEIVNSFEKQPFEPIELTESRFSFSIPDCPMVHVGKDISQKVRSKFCDLICAGGSKAIMDNVLGPDSGVCRWDKALIHGAGRCTLVFELVRDE
ncbi:MAG TPA: hypothetical protein VMS95_06465 [Candidatus Krumholzibacteriaceae bacterium]|jgi:hypothetical protein|nr:hypothetical protein [Candidatus Krumholzibacteriaceae bacterium]